MPRTGVLWGCRTTRSCPAHWAASAGLVADVRAGSIRAQTAARRRGMPPPARWPQSLTPTGRMPSAPGALSAAVPGCLRAPCRPSRAPSCRTARRHWPVVVTARRQPIAELLDKAAEDLRAVDPADTAAVLGAAWHGFGAAGTAGERLSPPCTVQVTLRQQGWLGIDLERSASHCVKYMSVQARWRDADE